MKAQKIKKQIIIVPPVENNPVHEPWKDVPIEVLIEEERKREELRKDHRERLYIPIPEYRVPTKDSNIHEEDDEYKIVIKL